MATGMELEDVYLTFATLIEELSNSQYPGCLCNRNFKR